MYLTSYIPVLQPVLLSYQPLSKPHTSLYTPWLCLCWFPLFRQPCRLLSTCRSPLFSPTQGSPYFLQDCSFFAFLSVMVMLYYIISSHFVVSLLSIFYPPQKKVSVSILMLGTWCLKIFFLQNECLVSPPRARRWKQKQEKAVWSLWSLWDQQSSWRDFHPRVSYARCNLPKTGKLDVTGVQ